MDKANLLQVISKPSHLSEKHLDQLEEIVASYPYCQIAHLLIAKYTHSQSSLLAPQKTRRAAAYALQRTRLRQLIENELDQAEVPTDIQIKTHFEQIDNRYEEKNEEAPSQTTSQTAASNENDHLNPAETSFFDTLDTEEASDDNNTSLEIEISEDQALEFYKDGKTEEAIRIYKQLILLNPHKEEYYQGQLDMLTEEEQSRTDAEIPELEEEQAPHSFFDDIDEIPKKPYLNDSLTHYTEESNTNDEKENEEATTLSEGQALAFYNEGKTREAIEVYRQLIANNPEKTEYYLAQVAVISSEAEADEIRTSLSDHNQEAIEEALRPEDITQNSEDSESFFSQIEQIDPMAESNEEPIASQSFFSQIEEETNNTSAIEEEGSQEEEPIASQSFFSQIEEEAQEENVIEDKDENETTQSSFFSQIEEEAQEENVIEDKDENETTQSSFFSQIEEEAQDEEVSLQTSENQAIMHFNNAEYHKAIEVYETLKAQNPQKSSYYIRQINVIKQNLAETEESLPDDSPIAENPPSPIAETDLNRPNISGIDPNEELQERHAFSLYSEGHLEQAIAVYEYLMRKHPEKEAYYRQQIEVLKS